MHQLIEWIRQYGLAFVFINVLVSQAGVPVPAIPTLVVAGAVIAGREHSLALVLAIAALGAVLADFGWYRAGRHFGRPILKSLCRISLSPDSCVRQTEDLYTRAGAPSLLFAKFIPGFAAVATAMAGAVETGAATFLLFDAGGAILWSGAALGAGMIFRDAIEDVLDTLARLGEIGVLIVVVAIALVVLAKWWDRHRFIRELRMARISVGELRRMVDAGEEPVILDVRSKAAQQAEGRIPGAVAVNEQTLPDTMRELAALSDEIIVYCACPNEASAAKIAKLLKERGFRRVRPLAGGIDAWVAAGYGIELGEPVAETGSLA